MAQANELPDAIITASGLRITPLANAVREHGFSSTSMLDIVTRARISKRDLYALFKNKHAVLAACISEHTEQMRRTLDMTNPVPQTREALTKLLVEIGIEPGLA